MSRARTEGVTGKQGRRAKVTQALVAGVLLACALGLALAWRSLMGPSALSLREVTADWGIEFPAGARRLGAMQTRMFRPEVWVKVEFPRRELASFRRGLHFELSDAEDERQAVMNRLHMGTYWGTPTNWWNVQSAEEYLVGNDVSPVEGDTAGVSRFVRMLVRLDDEETVTVYMYCTVDA